jgi:hypothetical protein
MNFLLLKASTFLLSVILFVWIFSLIRRRILIEEYSFLWILIAGVFLVLSFFHPLIDRVAYWLGIDYGPSALFLFFNVITLFILIHVSIQLSDYKSKKRILAQEIVLLKDRVEELERQRSEIRDQRSEIRDQRTEDRGRRAEIRGQRTEGGGQRAEDSGERSED